MYCISVYRIPQHSPGQVSNHPIWKNFLQSVPSSNDWNGMSWRSFVDYQLEQEGAVFNDIYHRLEFETAEQYMAFVLRYS